MSWSWFVEIKCPASLFGKVPSVENHLEVSDGQAKTKRNSEYYFQIQGQKVTERMYRNFFIYSFAGNAIGRLDFDENFWFDKLHLQLN